VRDAANVVQIIPVTSDKSPKNDYVSENIVFESADLGSASKKRKASDDISDRPIKLAPSLVLREAGHTLLEPRETWWIHQAAKERPPIYSSDGDILPYYLVSSFPFFTDNCRLSHYHGTRPLTNCAA
jgi:hypothetical protein